VTTQKFDRDNHQDRNLETCQQSAFFIHVDRICWNFGRCLFPYFSGDFPPLIELIRVLVSGSLVVESCRKASTLRWIASRIGTGSSHAMSCDVWGGGTLMFDGGKKPRGLIVRVGAVVVGMFEELNWFQFSGFPYFD
jgi:hypothetical protein